MTNELTWEPAAQWRTAIHAEHAQAGDHELVALQVAADGGWPEEFRWEILGPPNHETQLAAGQAETFDRAKAAAQSAWRKLVRGDLAPRAS
ncbi:MAG TPA: hypothetical protein VGV37_24425 [Aliidongia sp.]|uniref:hypothetical protein n=1 Tax=Aliidongia sp. TaxID=1914230 RepID=UPI002DDCBDB0|nr:hypothetical protein [Aliidongia sp.]HEV2677699.1 hypothetical protein [Aliidongia sp.]